jgi:hypothetical protein
VSVGAGEAWPVVTASGVLVALGTVLVSGGCGALWWHWVSTSRRFRRLGISEAEYEQARRRATEISTRLDDLDGRIDRMTMRLGGRR